MRKFMKIYRTSERDFGRKLNLIDNFSVDCIHRFSLDTFVSFENKERSVFLIPHKSNNNQPQPRSMAILHKNLL
jgi:hypothetical protein